MLACCGFLIRDHAVYKLGGLVRIGKSRIGQRGIRPSLESVISVEERLSVTDQMQMKNHGSDYVTIPAVSVRVAGSHKS